jgi:hypothetical protein
VSKKSFSIRKRLDYRNSFQPVLRATLESTDNGTDIITRVGLHPAVKVFMWFWFGMLFLVGGIIFILALSSFFKGNTPKGIGPIMGILIPPGMAIFGVALVKAGKFFAQDESEFLRHTVTDLLDAKEVR